MTEDFARSRAELQVKLLSGEIGHHRYAAAIEAIDEAEAMWRLMWRLAERSRRGEPLTDEEKRTLYAANTREAKLAQLAKALTPPEGPGLWVGRGEIAVIMRRMDELTSQIEFMTIHRVDTKDLQRAYDQVHRALTKAFGLPR